MNTSVKSNRPAGDLASGEPATHTPTPESYQENYWFRVANERALQIESDQSKISAMLAALKWAKRYESNLPRECNEMIDAAITRAESDGGGS